jgi:pilus assembly protein CpaE
MEVAHLHDSACLDASTSWAVRTRVVLASASEPLLRMVMRFLAIHPEIAVVGIAQTLSELERRVALLQPDVVLVDGHLIDGRWPAPAADWDGQWTGQIVALVDGFEERPDRRPFARAVTKSRLTNELIAAIDAAADRSRPDTCVL